MGFLVAPSHKSNHGFPPEVRDDESTNLLDGQQNQALCFSADARYESGLEKKWSNGLFFCVAEEIV